MGQVTRPTLGLADLFGAKGVSNNPSAYVEAVAPTIDVTSFLAGAGPESIKTELTTNPANGWTKLANLTVPTGRVWILKGFVLQVVDGAGDSFAGYAARFASSAVGGIPVGIEHGVLTQVGSSSNSLLWLDGSFQAWQRVLFPGEGLGFYVRNTTVATAINVFAVASVIELTA